MNNSTGTNIGANLMIAAFGTAVLAPVHLDSYQPDIPTSVESYNSFTENSWDEVIVFTDNHEERNFSSIKSFSQHLIKNTKDIEPEILEVVNENFWDLL